MNVPTSKMSENNLLCDGVFCHWKRRKTYFWTALDKLRGIKTWLHHWHFSLGTSYLSFLRFLKIWKFWSRKMPLCLYGAQARVPYRRKGIFWGQNFQIFKNLRNDRYDVPNEKCQWWSRVFMPLSWSRAVQKFVFRLFQWQNAPSRTESFSLIFEVRTFIFGTGPLYPYMDSGF